MSERKPLREFFTKVVGVTYSNEDGTSRQHIIAKCKKGEDMLLEWQPNNRYDSNAVAVRRRKTDKQIGFLARDVAERLVEQIEAGKQFAAEIHRIHGDGFFSGESLGVVLKIGVYSPEPDV